MEENSVVIDSSFLLAYLLPDEIDNEVQEFFDKLKVKNIRLIAPYLLIFEVFNGLQTAIIRKRINASLAKKLGEKLLLMPIELTEVDFIETLQLSNKYKLTFYDASYLYLSITLRSTLLTLDKELKVRQ